MLIARAFGRFPFQPLGFLFRQISRYKFRPSLCRAQEVKASVGSDPRQPTFHRTAPFKAFQLRKRFQKGLLRCFFSQTSLAKKSISNMKDPGAVTSNDFSEGRLVFRACLTRQLEVRRL